jgi:hypothetical protein
MGAFITFSTKIAFPAQPESMEGFIEDQASSPSYDLASPPPYPSPLSCQQVFSLSQSSCVSPVKLADESG